MDKDFDEKTVREILTEHPYLCRALESGLVARKLCQMILGVKKQDMDDIYVRLLKAGAIKAQSTSSFRATADTLHVLRSMEVIDKYDEQLVKEKLAIYPSLKIAFKSGLVSRRLIQAMLDLNKGDMDDLYVDLVRAGALKILASSAFRASESCMNTIAKMEDNKDGK